MKRFYGIFAALLLAAVTFAGGLVTSCGEEPIDIIITDYGYTVTLDDIHMAEGVYPECIIRLTSGGTRDESVTVNYKIDDDPSLRVRVDGEEVRPGSDVTFDVTGQLRLTLPALTEGRHKLHLVLTNRYGKSVSRDLEFNVIRDKVWVKSLAVPEHLLLEQGSIKDTTVTIKPAEADILTLSVASSDSSVAIGTVLGDGAAKVLRVDPRGDGAARLLISHADLPEAAVVQVEVFSYKIEGLNDITVEEGKDVTFSLSVTPEHDVSLRSSNTNVTVQDLGNKTYKVTGVTPGSSILTATAGNSRAEAVVTVAKKEETIVVSPMSAVIAYGATRLFSVVSSAEYRADISGGDATVTEVSASGVTVRNDNRLFTDSEATLTVVNRADENKKAFAQIKLDKRPESITLTESHAVEGRSVITVGGENGGWELTASPEGVRATVDGDDIVLVNDTYKTISGRVSVKTRTQGVTASKEVLVRGKEVTLSSLRLDPESFSVEVGRSFSMAVIGVYVDGSELDVTGSVSWTQSTNLKRSSNNFTGEAVGSAWVRATLDGKSVQADGSVTMSVTDLVIDPSYFNALVGDNKLFTVTAKYSNNTSRDVTRECTYNVTGGAKEAAKGYITMTDPGDVLVEALYAYDGKTYSATARGTVTKPVAKVVRVEVTPASRQVKVGETATFTGTVHFSDGSSDQTSGSWTVSDNTIVSGGGGTYVGLKEGSANILYSCGEASASATVVVKGGGGDGGGDLTGITLSRTSLEMAPGKVEQVSVLASYSDGSVKDVTQQAKWTSANQAVAIVNGYGYVVAQAAGETYITAEWSTKVAQLHVVVREEVKFTALVASPSSLNMQVYGQAQQVSLTAKYSNGDEEGVTSKATWATTDAAVATVDGGRVTPVKEGSCNITATYGGKTASVPVVVGAPELDRIELYSAGYLDYTCNIGDKYTLNAVAYYKGATGLGTAVTASAEWTASPSGIVSFSIQSNGNTITALKAGDVTITAEYGGKKATAKCHVKAAPPTVKGIVLDPSAISVAAGGSYDLSRISSYYLMSDGSRGSAVSVTYSLPTAAQSYATLSGKTLKVKEGVANGTSFSLTVKTEDYQYGATLAVTVSAAEWELTGLSVDSGAKVYVREGQTKNIADEVRVYALYHDKNGREADRKEDVTTSATWESLSYAGFEVVNKNQVKGKVAGTYSGEKGLRAVYNTKQAFVTVVVDKGEVQYKAVTGVKIYVDGAPQSGTLVLSPSSSVSLTASYEPLDADVQAISWTGASAFSLNPTSGKTTTLTAKSIGDGSVSVTVSDKTGGSKTATVPVSVKNVSRNILLYSNSGMSESARVYSNDEFVSWAYDKYDERTYYVKLENLDGYSAKLEGSYASKFNLNSSGNTIKIKPVGENRETSTYSATLVLENSSYNVKTEIGIKQLGKDASTLKELTLSIKNASKPYSVNDDGSNSLTVSWDGKDQYSNAYVVNYGDIRWEQSGGGRVSVSDGGVVKGTTAGSIKLKAVVGSVSSNELDIEVKHVTVPVTAISLSPSSLEFSKAGVTRQLTVSYTPSNADDKSVTWKSSDTDVVTVDASGNVTSVGHGVATVTAKTQNNVSASCSVDCSGIPIQVVRIESSEDEVAFGSSEYKEITITVFPEDATDKSLSVGGTFTGKVEMTRSDGNRFLYRISRAGVAGTSKVVFKSVANPSVYKEVSVIEKTQSNSFRNFSIVEGQTEYKLNIGQSALLNARMRYEYDEGVFVEVWKTVTVDILANYTEVSLVNDNGVCSVDAFGDGTEQKWRIWGEKVGDEILNITHKPSGMLVGQIQVHVRPELCGNYEFDFNRNKKIAIGDKIKILVGGSTFAIKDSEVYSHVTIVRQESSAQVSIAKTGGDFVATTGSAEGGAHFDVKYDGYEIGTFYCNVNGNDGKIVVYDKAGDETSVLAFQVKTGTNGRLLVVSSPAPVSVKVFDENGNVVSDGPAVVTATDYDSNMITVSKSSDNTFNVMPKAKGDTTILFEYRSGDVYYQKRVGVSITEASTIE